MSVFTVNKKPMVASNHLAYKAKNTLVFTVDGEVFPNANRSNYHHLKVMRFDNSAPNAITIDYGDGTSKIFNTNNENKILLDQSNEYRYTDNHTGERQVKITVENPKNLINFESSHVRLLGEFPPNIDKFINLDQVSVSYGYGLESINPKFITLPSLTRIGFYYAFKRNTPIYNAISETWLNKPLTKLAIGDADYRDLQTSNLNKIIRLKDTLLYLTLIYCRLTDLPQNFDQLTNTKRINANSNLWSSPPTVINSMTWLEWFEFGGGASKTNRITSWGNLDQLVNLQRLSCRLEENLPTTVPAYFQNLIRLKYLSVHKSYHTTERVDAFIGSFYDFIIQNAEDDKFKNMNIDIRGGKPSGIYQKPNGFDLLKNNGNPTSSLERIFVLEKNYGHKINYTL